MRKIIKKKIDIVINLAALIGIPYSYRASKSYLDTNVYGLLNILNACKDFGIKKIIHTSTSEVYGNPKFIPITESHPVCGQSPYAASKIAADQLALSYEKSFNLPITVLSVFKVKPSAPGDTVIAEPDAQPCVTQYKNSLTAVSQLSVLSSSFEYFSKL